MTDIRSIPQERPLGEALEVFRAWPLGVRLYPDADVPASWTRR